MAYDEALAQRVREALGRRARFTEIKMFGGLCFTVNGNMALGILNDDVMVRVGPDGYERALGAAGARPMDFTGKPLRGFVLVGRAGTRTARALDAWTAKALDYVSTLPAKGGERRRVSRARRRA